MDAFKGLESISEISLTPEFAYVIFDLGAAFLMTLCLIFYIGYLRSTLNIQPPKTTSDFPQFERAQRVHQNTLENSLFFAVNIIIGGIRHPILAAAFGLVWILARIFYAVGYIMNPKFRVPGFLLSLIALLALFGTAMSTAAGLLSFHN